MFFAPFGVVLASCATGGPVETPGFAFLGSGYDLLSGNPLSTSGLGDPGFRYDIFDWTYTQNLMTTDGKYRVADMTHSRTFDDCSSKMHTKQYNSAYSYKHMINTAFSANLNIGDIGGKNSGNNVDLNFGIDVRNTKNHTDNRSRIYSHSSAVCTRYQLEMNMFEQANLTDDFQRGVEMMPVDFDMDTYARFLTAFGTHYVSSMKVGGRWGMQMTFKSNAYQALLNHDVNVHAGITFVAGSVSGGLGINTTNDRAASYAISNAIYKNSSFSIGGDYSADPGTWMKSVAATPMPVHLTLTRLDSLFNTFNLPNNDASTLPAKAANLVKAINSWCHYHEKLTPGFKEMDGCAPDKPIPMPTPTPIGASAVRRVCVQNSGGYAINWHLIIKPGSTLGPQTGTYAAGNTLCIDGTDGLVKFGDTLGCKVDIIAGGTIECGQPWKQFNYQSHFQANYKCTGTLGSAKCAWDGLTGIGGQGGGAPGRRRSSPVLEELLE